MGNLDYIYAKLITQAYQTYLVTTPKSSFRTEQKIFHIFGQNGNLNGTENSNVQWLWLWFAYVYIRATSGPSTPSWCTSSAQTSCSHTPPGPGSNRHDKWHSASWWSDTQPHPRQYSVMSWRYQTSGPHTLKYTVDLYYNDITVYSHYNVITVDPHYNAITVDPHYNAITVDPHYNAIYNIPSL